MNDIPVPFEDEFPEEAAFMQSVFAAGGTFKRAHRHKDEGCVPPPRDIPRNHPCPCGSGRKTKKCHVAWTAKEAGFSEEALEAHGSAFVFDLTLW